jgi:hypothetical protein
MTEAINQMVSVPGLNEENIFAWIRTKKSCVHTNTTLTSQLCVHSTRKNPNQPPD